MIIRALLLTSLVALLTISTSNAFAGVCDLTTNGASCGPALFTNFAIFGEVSPQPTGTGYIDPFLRLQARNQEQGYTTSARPFQQDQKKPGIFAHDLRSSTVPLKTINGVQYREFFLDINETKNHQLLSFDELRIYLSATGERDSYDATTKTLDSLTSIYDLDAGGDNWIKLNYSLNHGSGSGDMVAYIPNSLFTGASTQYVYLFSRFGDHAGYEAEADAGFEEWWIGPATPQRDVAAIPEPATLLLLGSGLTLALRRRRKNAR
jgi:PEP-CTERM motif